MFFLFQYDIFYSLVIKFLIFQMEKNSSMKFIKLFKRVKSTGIYGTKFYKI